MLNSIHSDSTMRSYKGGDGSEDLSESLVAGKQEGCSNRYVFVFCIPYVLYVLAFLMLTM